MNLQRRLVVTDVSGQLTIPISKGQGVQEKWTDRLPFEDGIEKLSRNVGLRFINPRRGTIYFAPLWKPEVTKFW